MQTMLYKSRWYSKCNYTGEYAIIIGFNNSSLRNAVINQPEKGQGKEFISFVLPKECLSAIKKD